MSIGSRRDRRTGVYSDAVTAFSYTASGTGNDIDGLDEIAYEMKQYSTKLGWNLRQRLYLVPEAGAAVGVRMASDTAVVVPFRPTDALGKPEMKFVHLCGLPPAAFKGREWRFEPDRIGTTAGAMRLDRGPPGMTLADGELRWAVPADFADAFATAAVSAPDATGGKRVTATFTIRVRPAASPAPTVIRLPADGK